MRLLIAMTFLIIGYYYGTHDRTEFLNQAIHVAYEEGQKDLLIKVIDNETTVAANE